MQVEFSGRLGNQMFQYAFLVNLKKRFPNSKILINTINYKNSKFDLADVFNINADIAKGLQSFTRIKLIPYAICKLLKKETDFMYVYLHKIINENNINSMFVNDNSYFKGFWQSEKFFYNIKNELKNIFCFKDVTDENNIRLLSIISENKTVAIHIRRTDYLSNINRKEYVCLSETKYYENAINLFINDKVIFIFLSDDIEWCKKKFNLNNAIFVDWNVNENNWKDMYIMTRCDSVIVANSSFSWWGAYLNNKRDIYYPDIQHLDNKNDYYLSSWKKISIY